MQQNYDGNGLRVKKTDNGVNTYYLRSSVLGGQVVAEISGGQGLGEQVGMEPGGVRGLAREYVYLGGQLLALRNADERTYWVHEDPVTKGKRVTNSAGTIVSSIELDPWGADTNRSSNGAFQPKKFTSYGRDSNGSDEAMFRRYNRWHSRFDQPDPYDGSASLTNPQSFNRYAYTQNDPVNFVDPSGLKYKVSEVCFTIYGVQECWPTRFYWEDDPLPASRDSLEGKPTGGGGGQQNTQKLSPCLTELFGAFFPGLDLSGITIHTDGIPKVVEWFNTIKEGPGAVTYGSDVYYPANSYHPNSNEAIADLAHEITHVWQYSMLGKAGFAKQYAQSYFDNIVSQLPAGSKWPFSGYLYDTLARQTSEFMRWLKQTAPSIDLDKAYREIPLEQQAYDFQGDFLRFLNEVSASTGKNSVCP